jgi:hypothetical protein
MHVVGLVGVTALRSCDVHCLHWRLHLDDSATDVVGLWLGLVMVALRSALIGLAVGISVGTLEIGACSCMDHVICLLSSVWGMSMLAGAFTLGTRCVLQKWSGVMVSSNRWGFVSTDACVASNIRCESCVACEFLALPVIPWMALTYSANAYITLLACVMDGLVMRLC